jgi:hypothetical protein
MAVREKKVQFMSPKGVFKYPKLTEPDYGNEKFPKPDGEYKVTMVLSEDEAAGLIAKLTPLYEAALAAGQEEFKKMKVESRKKLKSVTENPLFNTVYDQDTEEPTGDVEFTFKSKAGGLDKDKKRWSRKPGVFDAKGKPLGKGVAVWGGTVGKVAFTCSPYFIPGTGMAGLKLQLEAAQVIELVSAGQRSANSYGFGEEEGYEYEEQFEDESSDSGNDDAADRAADGAADQNDF